MYLCNCDEFLFPVTGEEAPMYKSLPFQDYKSLPLQQEPRYRDEFMKCEFQLL